MKVISWDFWNRPLSNEELEAITRGVNPREFNPDHSYQDDDKNNDDKETK